MEKTRTITKPTNQPYCHVSFFLIPVPLFVWSNKIRRTHSYYLHPITLIPFFIPLQCQWRLPPPPITLFAPPSNFPLLNFLNPHSLPNDSLLPPPKFPNAPFVLIIPFLKTSSFPNLLLSRSLKPLQLTVRNHQLKI